MDARIKKTENKIFSALTQLLSTKEYHDITISELCIIAGINRNTFYLHYKSLDELVESYMNVITETFIKKFSQENKLIRVFDERVLLAIIKKLLCYIYENKYIFSIILNDPHLYSCLEASKKSLNNEVYETIRKYTSINQYYMIYILNGLYGIIRLWCQSGFENIDLTSEIATKAMLQTFNEFK